MDGLIGAEEYMSRAEEYLSRSRVQPTIATTRAPGGQVSGPMVYQSPKIERYAAKAGSSLLSSDLLPYLIFAAGLALLVLKKKR
jgi:hypothetical protein